MYIKLLLTWSVSHHHHCLINLVVYNMGWVWGKGGRGWCVGLTKQSEACTFNYMFGLN